MKLLTILPFGVLFWTFLEYCLHRFVFHLDPPPTSRAWITFHFIIHGQHHKVSWWIVIPQWEFQVYGRKILHKTGLAWLHERNIIFINFNVSLILFYRETIHGKQCMILLCSCEYFTYHKHIFMYAIFESIVFLHDADIGLTCCYDTVCIGHAESMHNAHTTIGTLWQNETSVSTNSRCLDNADNIRPTCSCSSHDCEWEQRSTGWGTHRLHHVRSDTLLPPSRITRAWIILWEFEDLSRGSPFHWLSQR